MRVTLKVKRQASAQSAPYWEAYTLEAAELTSVGQMLEELEQRAGRGELADAPAW